MRKHRRHGTPAAGLAALALLAAAPLAALPDSPGEAAITVTGDRSTPEEREREAYRFVRETGVANGHTPVARWIDPVCFRVIGLDTRHADLVMTAARSVAAQVGAPLAKAPCTSNAAIVFTHNAAGLVKRVAERDPRRFTRLAPGERQELVAGSAPVRWWYSTDVRTRDGVPARSAPAPWTAGNSESGGSVVPMNDDSTVAMQSGSSVVSTLSIRTLRGATVVVDVDLAEGVPLQAVGIYAAFVTLAEFRNQAAPPGSILALFDKASPVFDLTERDRQFMTALYRMPLDRPASQQRARLVRGLTAAEIP